MKIVQSKNLVNLFFVFILIYLIYHLFNGRYTIQNYFISKFEKEMFEKLNQQLKQDISDINMDLNALYYEKDDFIDEIIKRNNFFLNETEIVLKLD
jgi:cell division protein FtsB